MSWDDEYHPLTRRSRGWTDYLSYPGDDELKKSDFKLDDGLTGAPKMDAVNDLDCIHCHQWFPTFDRLARHMAARHGKPTPNDPGMVELPARRNSPAFIMPERKTTVAKKATKRKATSGIPAPQHDENSEFNPFLKADEIGKIGAEATLTLTGQTRVVDGAFGEQLVCEVKYGRGLYDWPVKLNSPNHRLLFQKFGENPKKWRGAVKVVIAEHMRKNYIAVQRTK